MAPAFELDVLRVPSECPQGRGPADQLTLTSALRVGSSFNGVESRSDIRGLCPGSQHKAPRLVKAVAANAKRKPVDFKQELPSRSSEWKTLTREVRGRPQSGGDITPHAKEALPIRFLVRPKDRTPTIEPGCTQRGPSRIQPHPPPGDLNPPRIFSPEISTVLLDYCYQTKASAVRCFPAKDTERALITPRTTGGRRKDTPDDNLVRESGQAREGERGRMAGTPGAGAAAEGKRCTL